MSLGHLLRQARVGDRVRFDPTLAVRINGGEVFQGPKGVLRVAAVGALRPRESDGAFPFWRLAGEDGGQFLMIEDGPSNLLFLLRLVAEAAHNGETPDFLSPPSYSIHDGPREIVYEHYSDPLMAASSQGPGRPQDILLRVFVRPVGEDGEEFLWIMLVDDRRLDYYVGVIVDPAQILHP